MKYINSDIILNSTNLKTGKYAWLLLGDPVSNGSIPDLPIPDSANGSRAPSFDGATKKMKIRDETIAGISFCNDQNISGVVSETGNDATVTFPASGRSTEIFCKVGNESAPYNGFNVNNLALVKIKNEIYEQVFIDNEYNSEKSRRNFFYFNQTSLPNNEYNFTYIPDTSTSSQDPNYRIMDKIDAVLVIYSIISSANEPVNYINYTGFNVGESVLTISGLNQD